MEEKELVTALIADHLKHMKMLYVFEKAGFDVLDHYLALPETILKLMKTEKSETIFQYFMTGTDLVCEKKGEAKEVAEEMYDTLVWMREEMK